MGQGVGDNEFLIATKWNAIRSMRMRVLSCPLCLPLLAYVGYLHIPIIIPLWLRINKLVIDLIPFPQWCFLGRAKGEDAVAPGECHCVNVGDR